MSDLSQTAGSNYPVGSEAIGNNLDNYMRAHAALIRQSNALASSTIAAASTVNVSASDGESVQITGAATISSLGTGFNGCKRELRFSGACTLVHSASLQLPGAADIVTASGQLLKFRCIGTSTWILAGGNWTMPSFFGVRAANSVLAGPTSGSSAVPSFRALVNDDIPSLDASKITTGALPVTRGGTGLSSLASGQYIKGNGTSVPTAIAPSAVLADIGAVAATGPLTFSSDATFGYVYGDGTTNANGLIIRRNGVQSYLVGSSLVRLAGGGVNFDVTSAGAGVAGSMSDSIGDLRDVPQRLSNASNTCILSDRGKHVYSGNSTGYNWTVPPNSTTAFPVGSTISFVHGGAGGTKAVLQGSGVSFIHQDGSTGNVSLTTARRSCTLLKVDTDTWLVM